MHRILPLLLLATLALLWSPLAASADGLAPVEDVATEAPPDVVHELADVLADRLLLPSGRHHVAHCRIASEGCGDRASSFARMFVDAGERHGLDPFLLAALAIRESGLDPSALSPIGAAGIMQLHPRGVGARVPFVRDEHARRRCLDQPGACQGPIVDIGAAHLSRWLKACPDVEAAIGGYASGRCAGAPSYSRRVMRELERLSAARTLRGS